MTSPRLPDRDTSEVDALVADRYLDALLAGAESAAPERRSSDGGSSGDASPGADVRHAAGVLHRSLVRVHPSFHFEERLATRLAHLAAMQADPAVAAASRGATGATGATGVTGVTGGTRGTGGFGGVIPFPSRVLADPDLDAILRGDLDPSAAELAERSPADRRPLLVTGAITSAALSIAGVAWVAWRASRPQARGGPMGRAVRQAHARRAGSIAGIGGPA